MATDPLGKIEVTIGQVTFSGEGTQGWLAEQLDKVLDTASGHSPIPDEVDEAPANAGEEDTGIAGKKSVGSLANYLKTQQASTHPKRFIATAAWLTEKGNKLLKTADVTKALRTNQQSKLSNPADALNKNVAKGFCEKTGDGFFITPEGWADLGKST